jgi:hypothetical protein
VNERILKLQTELQRRAYGYDITGLSDEDLIEYIRWNVVALEHEIHEALDECSWKPWQSSSYVNRHQLLKELIDAAHFLNNIWIAVCGLEPGPAADLFEEMYVEKNVVNARRVERGYDGVSSKCPHCRRALDDGTLLTFVSADGDKLEYCPCGFVLHREEAT